MDLSKLPKPRFSSWISLGPSRETKIWQLLGFLISFRQSIVPLVIIVTNISLLIKSLTSWGKSGRVKTSPPHKIIDLSFISFENSLTRFFSSRPMCVARWILEKNASAEFSFKKLLYLSIKSKIC